MSKTVLYQDTLKIQGDPAGVVTGQFKKMNNPQPVFRDFPTDLPVAAGPDFPKSKMKNFGRETAPRILPWKKQDRYNRDLISLSIPILVLENDFLKAEIVPSMGGRLWSLYDKKNKRDILYKNPIFRPANLAIREAWFSGGVEWNIGRFGHTVHSCTPVFSGTFDMQGFPVLRLWEFEAQTRLFWRIEFYLPQDEAVLYTYVKIENLDNENKPLYWWTNAAVPETEKTRIFSSTENVIYLVPDQGKLKTMAGAVLPELPTLPGKDATYPVNSTYSNEYFFQCEEAKHDNLEYPWEVATYGDGYSYAEASTGPLFYRKMFCWGTGPGGQHWQDFLSLPGQRYLEVQAGLAPTQIHTANIAALSTVDWVQAFGAMQVDPEKAHQNDYPGARGYIGSQIAKAIPPSNLHSILDKARTQKYETGTMFSLGTGWGALEEKLHKAQRGPGIPGDLSFPAESITAEETPWLTLIYSGTLPANSALEGPGSFAVNKIWEALLLESAEQQNDWLCSYHLGVIAMEEGETAKAESYWKQSLEFLENAWAYRNLAILSCRRNDKKAALDYYEKALNCPEGESDPSFMEEYIPLLVETGNLVLASEKLREYIKEGSGHSIKNISQPLFIAAAKIALALKDDVLLDKIFATEPVHLREGNNIIVDIWRTREVERLMENSGTTREKAEEKIQADMASGITKPPKEIDFRMYT